MADSRERDYVIYVHIDVNLDGRGWVCCCSTFNGSEKKLVALLLEIEATCPLINMGSFKIGSHDDSMFAERQHRLKER